MVFSSARSFIVFSALSAALAANACTAIVAGRKASGTGHVLLGQNEDVPGAVMRHAMLPRREGKAAAFWSEAKVVRGGGRVAACFYNEYGVFVMSNNGGVMSEWDGVRFSLPDEGRFSTLSEGGIDYHLRIRMIEQARSAREGVKIMAELVDRLGYRERSRNFLVADANEAWIMEVLQGRRYVARRVPDDEVAVYPNCLVFNRLKEGDIASENIRAKGPAFDVIAFYQGPRTWRSPYNFYRWRELYRIAAGVEVDPGDEYPFSVRPAHLVSVADIKRGLASHYEGRPFEVKERHPKKNPKIAEPLCRRTTVQSLVCELNPDPSKTVFHLTVGRPCEVSYGTYRPFGGELPADTVSGAEAIGRLVDFDKPLPRSEGRGKANTEH